MSSVRATAIEPRAKGVAVRVRVESRYGDFHLEVPVELTDPTAALKEARRMLFHFFKGEMLEAIDSDLELK
jgi:hypothetical protein